MSGFLEKLWYGSHRLQWVLSPLSIAYKTGAKIRRWYLQTFHQVHFSVPVIAVGNLTVGGVGKTPLVVALAKELQNKGLKVGIVSRGYGAHIKYFPYQVKPLDSAWDVGDEPLLLTQKTQCPVVIDPVRTRAVRYLLDQHQCQIIISDDGLQHYRMGRAIELLVIDGTRGFGNGKCLPAGPLKESMQRLHEVDFAIVNEGMRDDAYSMTLKPGALVHLATNQQIGLDKIRGSVAAVAAIGNPQRFYATLAQLGIQFNAYSYPDHYHFTAKDLIYNESVIIMTEKDAVKCRLFSSDKLYYLPVEAVLEGAFWDAFWSHKGVQGCIQ